MSNNPDQDYQQTTELIVEAFSLFDTGRTQEARERAALMMGAAQASATLLAVKEQRVANLVALASVPEHLQVDQALTREAFITAGMMMGLVEDGAQMDGMENDPADKDVTE